MTEKSRSSAATALEFQGHATLSHYMIAPLPVSDPPEVELTDIPERWSSPGVGWWYFALWVVVVNPVAMQIAQLGQQGSRAIGYQVAWMLFPFVMIAVILRIWYVHGRVRGRADRLADLAKAREVRKLEIDRLIADAAREAVTTADSLRQLLLQAADFRLRSTRALDAASTSLDRSAADYEGHAFSPFWDSIEETVGHLTTYEEMVRRLATTAQRYSSALCARRHTFPAFPYCAIDLPPASEILVRLQVMVRRAQSEPVFASIWEQRKTRESIETGFGSLSAAVRSVGSAVSAAVREARTALEASLREARNEFAQQSSATIDAIAAAGKDVADASDRQREEVKAILQQQNRSLGAIK